MEVTDKEIDDVIEKVLHPPKKICMGGCGQIILPDKWGLYWCNECHLQALYSLIAPEIGGESSK